MSESEDESSDSSNEFLVSADQINLNSSFFDEKTVLKPNPKTPAKKAKTLESSDSEASDDVLEDFKPEDVDNAQSAELFSQILKNLERERNLESLREQESSSKNNGKNDGSMGESSKSGGLASEIKELLLQGESGVASSSFQKHNEEDEEDEEKPETSSEYTIPKEGVQITLPGTQIMLERKKKKTDLETLLKNKMNQRIRSTQVLIHKVGLLWWLVYGFHLNRLANDPEILATCLSLISKNDYPKGRVDLVYVRRITIWFNKTFPLDPKQVQSVLTTESILERIREKKIYDYRELVIIYVALLRAIGLNCRLVVSLSPPPLKPKREQLFQTKKEEEEVKKEPKPEKSKDQNKKSAPKSAGTKSKKKKKQEPKKIIPENSQDGKKNAQMVARKKAAAILKKGKPEEKAKSGDKSDSKSKSNSNTRSGSKVKSSSENVNLKEDANSDEDFEDFEFTKPRKSVSKQKVVQKTRKLIYSEEESDSSEKSGSKVKSTSANVKAKEDDTIAMKLRKRITKPTVCEPLTSTETDNEDSDDEFVFRKSYKREKNRKFISSEEENESEKKKTPLDVWVEVYVEDVENWISVSVPTGNYHCVNEIYKRASDPVLYVVAYNSGGSVKDVTRRYCPHWLTVTRKQRVDENWWIESLAPWKEKNTALSRAEDELLLQRELEQPLPKTVGECKGHPLYALVRHLLKFEALYPPDVVPLGYLKNGEAIYSRHCVHTLRSRETWVKHARVVKPAQEAYKVVTSMPKYDKFSGTKIKGLPLDLFGKWQTTPYVPPEAKDGIVPRNEYGNVDLFQMCMLPKGTVHIDLPGLNRIARKLNIDCAPAVVGFNFGGMGAVPAFEGFVVCTEFEDTLREAWEVEQIEAAKRATEKRDKRIYKNWRKLINGLLIRERLAARYSAADADEESNSDPEQPVSVVRNQVQMKGKKGRTQKEMAVKDEEKPAKKVRVTKKEAPSKKEPKSKEKKASEEVAATSSRLKRGGTKRNYEEEDSDADFEVKKPKIETRSQKNKIS